MHRITMDMDISDMHWKIKGTSKFTRKGASILGIIYFFLFAATIMWTTVLYAMPALFPDSTDNGQIHYVLFVFLWGNLLANYCLCCATKSFYMDHEPRHVPEHWNYCLPCGRHLPPRAHHCLYCEKCVLKRDHHCFFTGSCVGYFNQRRFVMFNFYTCLSSLHVLGLLLQYLEILNGPTVERLLSYIFPVTVYDWYVGYMPTFTLLVVLEVYVCVVACIGCGGLFGWQIMIIRDGRTDVVRGR
ncbi:putative ZDHHC-type palmitoyltransferase 2 [Branchiostoma lanceolatum]|uniref:putative ZDHHC-type palmitoyltransferase 2 n=1 Tax=Branchiostoma lanceolatum TaxID=7740 RepID=UPI003454FA93